MKPNLSLAFLAGLLSLAASAGVLAQTSTATVKPANASKPAATAKPRQGGASRTEIRSTANQMAAGISAAEAALDASELAIAAHVHTGVMPCELGASVTLESDARLPGYFNLHGKNFRFRMIPVVTSTGAIRLEDRQAGAVWLQLSNKSMLMNQKAGKRMADECMSPGQMAVAQGMKNSPPPSLLDALPTTLPADLVAPGR